MQKTKATVGNNLPSPVSTEEVEEYILKKFGKDVFPFVKTPVAYALGYLSKPKPTPALMKLRRSSFGRCLWIPANTLSDEYKLDGNAKNKSEITNLLVQKAVEHYKRPVTADEISKMIESFPNLETNGRMCLEEVVNKAKFSLVNQIGSINGDWYYFYGNISEEASQDFILLRNSELLWSELKIGEALKAINLSKLSTVAFGRMLLLEEIVQQLLLNLQKSLNKKSSSSNQFFEDIKILTNKIKESSVELESAISQFDIKRNSLPHKVMQQRILLNSAELSEITKPFLLKAKEGGSDARVADLTGRQLKRHFNPNYKPCFGAGKHPNKNSRYLFDSFDVTTYIAKHRRRLLLFFGYTGSIGNGRPARRSLRAANASIEQL